MDNVIKQGYLKKAKATPANRSSMATQILQMFEPQRWYVLGLRSRRPYLEYYDKEEHVFSEQPINTYDLGRCQRLTYTLGRTNKNWTFCLFLQDRVIELTAESRSAMLDWCRVLERALHNYGCLQKYDSSHIYSEFPIKPVPTKSEEIEDNLDVNTSGIPTLSLQLDENGGDEAAGSSETTPVNSPGIQHEEIIFGTQFSLMEAMNQDSSETTEESDPPGMAGIDGVVYRRKAGLKPDSELDTSEDDFVTKDFWLNNKLPPVPKRNKAPPLPDRSMSLVMPTQEQLRGMDTQDTTLNDHMLLNVTSKKERDTKSHSAPIVPSSFQKSIPPIPPRNKGDNSIQETEEKDIGGACGSSLATTNGSKITFVEDLDDGYQSILECTGRPPFQGPKFFKSQKENKPSRPERSKTDHHSKQITDYENTPAQKHSPTNIDLPSKTVEDSEVTDYENTPIQGGQSATNNTDNSQSKGIEENMYSPFPGSGDDDNNSSNNITDEAMESTTVKKIHSGNSNKVDSKDLSGPFMNVYEDCCVPKRKISPVSDVKIQPGIPLLETIPKVTSPSFTGDIVCPPRKTVNPLSDVTPALPSLDTLPSRNLSPDHNIKSFPPLPLPPSIDTLPKRGLTTSLSNEHSQPLKQISPSDPQSPPIPPTRKISTSNSNKFSSSFKSNVSVIDVTNRPLPSLPTEEGNKSPPIVITNGRTSPSFDDFKFETKNKKSSSLSSNSSTSDVDPLIGASPDYEDATMRNKPPMIPPRLRNSLEGRSQSVYVSSSSKEDAGNSSAQEEKATKGVIRQASLQDRQRINRSSGSFTVVPLKHSQAELLREEQALHGVGITIHCKSGPRVALVDSFQGVCVTCLLTNNDLEEVNQSVQSYKPKYIQHILIAGWDFKLCPRLADKLHIGDELIKINDTRILNSSQAYKIMKHEKADSFDFVVKRIPYGKVIAMRRSHEREPLGINREGGTAVITYVNPSGLAAQGGLEKKAKSVQESGTACNWMLTEINNRPLNLSFKGNEIEHLLNAVGKDISVVVQPEEFVKSLKKQLKKLKNYKDYLAPS